MTSTSIFQYQEPRRLHGIPGIVYVLTNTALKENIVRVGLSRRSGWAKAAELNRDKANTLPGIYECIFEAQAQDGGVAIDAILKELQNFHFGKKEQDFFSINHEVIEEIVFRIVELTNEHVRDKFKKTAKIRDHLAVAAHDKNIQIQEKEEQNEKKNKSSADIQKEMNQHKREGIFDKANLWVNKILN